MLLKQMNEGVKHLLGTCYEADTPRPCGSIRMCGGCPRSQEMSSPVQRSRDTPKMSWNWRHHLSAVSCESTTARLLSSSWSKGLAKPLGIFPVILFPPVHFHRDNFILFLFFSTHIPEVGDGQSQLYNFVANKVFIADLADRHLLF